MAPDLLSLCREFVKEDLKATEKTYMKGTRCTEISSQLNNTLSLAIDTSQQLVGLSRAYEFP